LDLAALRDTGETVTHNTYVALQNGPVVAHYPKRLIKALEDRGIARQDERWDGAKPVSLISDCSTAATWSPEIISLASKIAPYFAGMTSGQASEYSHLNPGWKIAWDQRSPEGRPVAINMLIALQQIVEDDPWLDLPLSSEELGAVESADRADGEEW
jgi:hypothetical protein